MEEALIRYCAPTLAAIKTAGAFTYPYRYAWEIEMKIQDIGARLTKKGVAVLPLALREKRALIYAFRPSLLARDLQHEISLGILSAYKYPKDNLILMLRHLSRRIEAGAHFPHEMGLFLGYPPLDVLGFILNGGAHYKRAGLWKVYGDEKEAQGLFKHYKQCTEHLLQRHYSGARIEDITVFS